MPPTPETSTLEANRRGSSPTTEKVANVVGNPAGIRPLVEPPRVGPLLGGVAPAACPVQAGAPPRDALAPP